MRILFSLCFSSAAVFALMICINVYDYLFSPAFPWREGDFFSVMLANAFGFTISATAAFWIRKMVRKS